MTEQIIIDGIDRVSSEANKGWCEELINARPTKSGMVLERPRKEISANLDVDKITPHNIDGEIHWLGIKDGYICEFNIETGVVVQNIYAIEPGADVTFCAMDNMIIISDKAAVTTTIFLHKNGSYSLFLDNFNFSISPKIEMNDPEGLVIKYNNPDKHEIDNDKYERIDAIGEYSTTTPPPKEQVALAVSSAINKMLTDNNTWCIGSFIYAFTVTLWDDKEYPISGIRALSTVNASFPYGHKYRYSVNGGTNVYTRGFAFSNVAITTDDGRYMPEGGCEARLYKEAMYIQEVTLTMQALEQGIIDKYKEVIKKVNLYVSKPILPWRIDSKYLSYEYNDTTDFQKLKFVFGDANLKEDGLLDSQMFLNKSWDLQELKEDIDYKLEFRGDSQTNEDTMPVLDSTLRAGDMFIYNKRVHLYNSINKMKLYDTPVMDISDISGDVFNTSFKNVQYSKHILGSMSAYIHYRLNTEEKVVRYDGLPAYALQVQTDTDTSPKVDTTDIPYDKPVDIILPEDATRTSQLSLRPVVMIPDSRAFKVDLILDDNSKILSLDLTPSGSYNFAYAYIQPYNGFCNYLYDGEKYGYEKNAMQDMTTEAPEYTRDLSYKDNISVNVSEQSNPIVYNPTNAYTFDGEILGMNISTEKFSESQIGMFPLVVFTGKGIYALQQGQGTILYSNIVPINADVLDGATLQTRHGIVYSANGCIYLLQGNKAVNISHPLNGEIDTYLHSNRSYNLAVKNAMYIDLSRYLCSVPFREYVKDCILSYSPHEEDIIVSNLLYHYSFVFNLNTRMWHKITDCYIGYLIGDINLKRLTAEDAQPIAASAEVIVTGFNNDAEQIIVAQSYCTFGEITCNAGDRIDLVIDGVQAASINFTWRTKTNLIIESLLDEIKYIRLVKESEQYRLYSTLDLSGKTIRIVNITRNIIYDCLEGTMQHLTPHTITIPVKGAGEQIRISSSINTDADVITIQSGDTPDSICNKIAQALNGKAGINAIYYGNKVIVTAITPGAAGNSISIFVNAPDNIQFNNNDMFIPLSGGQDTTTSGDTFIRLADYSEKIRGERIFHLETRPFSMQEGAYTLVRRLILDCRLNLGSNEYCNIYLFSSDNKIDWKCTCAAQATNVKLSSLRAERAAQSYKYYVIAVNGKVSSDGLNNITKILCEYNVQLVTKLR